MSLHFEDVALLKRARRVLVDPNTLGTLSTGQIAAVAFVLDNPDYLKSAGLSMAQALTRFERSEIESIEFAAQHLHDSTIG